MKKLLISILVVLVLLTACASPPPEAQPPTEPLPSSPTPQLPTETPEPTATTMPEYTPTPAVHREQISVAYEDRVIRGTLLGDGDIAVILAPGWTVTRSRWMDFAKHIAELGYTAVAIDFPGAGLSTGSVSLSKMTDDVIAVFDYLQQERGFEKIACFGESHAGFPCFDAAIQRPEMAGLVVLSAVLSSHEESEAAVLTMPKLLIASNEVEKQQILDSYDWVPMPKEVTIFNSPAHATDLFQTEVGEELRDMLVAFLDSLR